MADQLVRGDLGAGHDDGVDGLAPALVGHAEHGRLEHGRVAEQHVLDLGAVDVLAAGDDHVLGPVDEVHVAVVVHVAEVAGVVPAVDERGGRLLGLVPVADHDVLAPDDHLADLAGRQAGPVRRRPPRCRPRPRAARTSAICGASSRCCSPRIVVAIGAVSVAP